MKNVAKYPIPSVITGFSWAYTFYLIEKLKELAKEDKIFIGGKKNAKRLDEGRYTKKELQNINRHAFCPITPISETVIRKIIQQTEMPLLEAVNPYRANPKMPFSHSLMFPEVNYIIKTAEEFLSAFPPPKDP
ncbi:MAG: hypothetical protein NUV83_02865 [Candidatus Wolfebacteria bacterium]|nr:hypothetical protein [Candidatus Wolfebacteria bacterium]